MPRAALAIGLCALAAIGRVGRLHATHVDADANAVDLSSASASASLLPDVDDIEYQANALSTLETEVINGTVVGHSCELGTYLTGTAVDSGDCSGFRPCEPGYYCTLSRERVACPAGTYGANAALFTSECSGPCAAGFYCPTGSTSSTEMPCGGSDVYCPEGSSAPTPVEPGHYTVDGSYEADGWSNRTRTRQLLCPQGHYCVGGVRYGCPAGTYSTAFGATACDAVCPAGHFCPRGSVEPRPCDGTLAYCPEGSGVTLPVQPRHYAVSVPNDAHVRGANLSTGQVFCPPGSYCVGGVRLACPTGRYGSAAGEIDPLCTGECDEGYYCPPGSTSPRQVSCGGAGLYCPRASAEPTAVAVGYYSVGGDGELTRTGQRQCEPGYWCEGGLRYECFDGHYGAAAGA
jgi:hypothetical protein